MTSGSRFRTSFAAAMLFCLGAGQLFAAEDLRSGATRATLQVNERAANGKAWDELSETIIPKVVEAPAVLSELEQEFPKLTPAGLDPMERPIPANFEANSTEVAERINARNPEGRTNA